MPFVEEAVLIVCNLGLDTARRPCCTWVVIRAEVRLWDGKQVRVKVCERRADTQTLESKANPNVPGVDKA